MTRFFYLSLLLVVAFSCKTVYKVQTGDDAFELKRYAQAIPLYQAELQSKNRDQLYTNLQLAECHTRLRQHNKALPFYRQAIKEGAGYDIWLKYSSALIADNQFENARKALVKINKDFGTSPEYNNLLGQLNRTEDSFNQTAYTYIIDPIEFNSKSTEYGFYDYKGTGIYTSDKQASLGSASNLSGEKHTDVFAQNAPIHVQRLLSKINTEFNESTLVINQKGDHAVFTRCGIVNSELEKQTCQLYESMNENGVWSDPTKIPFCTEEDNYFHATFFNQDIGIVFSSNRPDGIGNYDLWIAYKRGDQWMEPSLLPEGINTDQNEVFPTSDLDTLYYSSNGTRGYGALDILKTIWQGNGWEAPKNLGSPYNSSGDDFSFISVANENETAVSTTIISSNRKGGKGGDDILTITKFNRKENHPVVGKKKGIVLISGKVFGITYENDQGTQKRRRIELNDALVTYTYDDKVKTISQNDPSGFEVGAPVIGKYDFKARSKGYLSNSKSINIKTVDDKTARYLVEIELEPITYDEEILLENIYYDFDKWDIRADALPSLDKLATMLKDNPDIKIELSSHTDCQGEEAYNYELSQRRAQSATNYIIQNGIDPRRIVAKGYGKSRLKMNCVCDDCTDEEHQVNRRTAFTIIR